MVKTGGEAAMLRWEEDRLLPEAARLALTGPSAPFEMAVDDVLGSPMHVFAQRFRTAPQMLDSAAERLGDQPFLIFPDRTYTYRSIHAPVAAMAAALKEQFGVDRGDRVGIVAANVPGHAVTAWAAVSIGAVVIELNGWWTGPELLHGIELTKPKVVFGDRRRLDRIPDGSVDVPVVCFEDDFDRMVTKWDGSPAPREAIDEDDPLCILFTSGTTGRAKGAVLSHRCHVNMMTQAALQGQVGLLLEPPSTVTSTGTSTGPPTGTSSGTPIGPEPAAGQQVSIGVSPMFHISGFSVALIGGPFIGATIAYPPPGRWDPEVQLEMTERFKASAWSIVPTQLWRLIEHPRFDEFDLSSLRRVGGGGSTFQPELWRKVREKLPQVNRMATGYGMTETCGAGTHQDGRAALEHPDAVGAPVPGYEICVRGLDGDLLAAGEIGEIQLRGPSNFLGYWDNPEATREALGGDRWYHTGELGRIEHGLLFLEGRGVDLIIRGGENVYPIEIENRLIEHPAVAEAAVIGVPDRVLGEEVKAVVVAQPGTTITLDEIRTWVAEELASFKVPSQLQLRSQLPHNATGKVLKHLLKSGDPDESGPNRSGHNQSGHNQSDPTGPSAGPVFEEE